MDLLFGLIAYGAIILAIIIFTNGSNLGCNQDCKQGRNCDCEDDNE